MDNVHNIYFQNRIDKVWDMLKWKGEHPSINIDKDRYVGAFALYPNFIFINRGLLTPFHTDEEIAFIMAHELGHIEMGHFMQLAQSIGYIMEKPSARYGGLLYIPWMQKIQENQADLWGYKLYKESGLDMGYFSRTYEQIKQYGSDSILGNWKYKDKGDLDPADTHMSILSRYKILKDIK